MLLGWAGRESWPAFAASPESADGLPHPLDRWTRRTIDRLARDCDATPLYPFDGPPWYPFQTWSLRAGIGYRSPIGLLIHPRFGLWHAYRAALGFADRLALPPVEASANPCETCIDRPCLTTCPVDAFSADAFAVDRCRDHLQDPAVSCRSTGCLARDACPVGRDARYSDAQVLFHQRAFMRG